MAHPFWLVRIVRSLSGSNITLGELQFRTTAGVSLVPSGGTPIASVEQGGLNKANLFDGNATTGWAANGAAQATIGYAYAAPLAAVEVAMTSWTGDASHSPQEIIVFGSDDGVTMYQYLRQTGISWTGGGQTQAWALSVTGTQVEVPSLVAHSVLGSSDAQATIAAIVQHTVHGASPTEIWVPSIVQHTVLMETPVDPDVAVQRITVSVSLP